MAYSELPWRPFLVHQAWSWTTLRRGGVFYYVYKRLFLFLSRLHVLTFLNFYSNVFTSMVSMKIWRRERDGSWSDDEAGYGSHDDRDNVSAGHRFCWLRLQIFQLRSVRKFSVRARVLKASSHRHTRHDKTAAPACRPPSPRRRPGRQLRLATRPPTRSDVVRHAQCTLLTRCGLLHMTKPTLLHWTPRDEGDLSANCSDFARRSRDSVHTARHDTDSTVLSCPAGGVNWALWIFSWKNEQTLCRERTCVCR